MLIVLSPAKTLDFENAPTVTQATVPQYGKQAAELVKLLKKYSVSELMELMHISQNLASLNAARFKTWTGHNDKELERQAICAFKGDVYTGLNVTDWTGDEFSYAQEHIRILSGLYGVLRPLDYINPYRLEMGTKLETNRGNTLYKYWGDMLTKNIAGELKNQSQPVLINLASNEYFKSLNVSKLKTEVITPVFKDFKNGKYQLISFFAKKARGSMARFVVKNRIEKPENLKTFTGEGYFYNDRLSKGNEWVFTRD